MVVIKTDEESPRRIEIGGIIMRWAILGLVIG